MTLLADRATIREFTQRCTDVLEMYVRRHPSLWLWMHRRWRDTGATALVTLNALRLLRFKGAPEANHGDDAGRPTTLSVPSAR